MTNEEKAEELYLNVEQPTYDDKLLAAAFTRGADWKDQQVKEYLEKKLGKYAGGELVYAGVFIKDIINELFEETESDNSDREE